MHDVTQLLRSIEDGNMQATEDLLPVVYGELRRLANAKMRHEKSNHTLTSTALVHEAYLRLVEPSKSSQTACRQKTIGNSQASIAAESCPGGTAETDGPEDTATQSRGSEGLGNTSQQSAWANRSHFFAAAAEAMRRILIENARRKQRIKHGGQMKRHNVEDVDPAIQRSSELIALDDALDALLAENEVAGNLIKLRFYAGLTIPQAAWSLGISESQAKRLWAYARAWLYRRMYTD